MRNKSAAFENATEALLQLGIPKVLPTLHGAGLSIARSILGGSHSVVTYPPLNALRSCTKEVSQFIRYGAQTGLYVHIAFCETRCSFCHYDVEVFRHQEADYMRALERELGSWGMSLHSSGTAISSIYIGGGTPLVLSSKQLVELIRRIRSEFNVLPGAEICLEGSPLTITAADGFEKLQALKERGVTRLSFGVQSFDDRVLKRAARGYGREVAVLACSLVSQMFDKQKGLNWNLDLIQSLNVASPDTVWEDLQVLRQVRPPHLTWYHGRFDSRRPQGKWLEGFETEEDTLTGRMLIWRELAGMGYGRIDGNRFVREAHFVDPFKKVRTSVSSDLLGIGSSAYSHVDMRQRERSAGSPEGLFFRNVAGKVPYTKKVGNEGLSVGSSMALDSAEYLAASYVVGLRTVRIETESDRAARAQHPALSEHYDQLVEELIGLGMLERVPNGLRLSELGRLFEDEILSRFYSPRVRELLC